MSRVAVSSALHGLGFVQLTIETNKKLGQLVGLHKLNADGEATRIVGCSAALVTDYGEETEALKVLKAQISRQG